MISTIRNSIFSRLISGLLGIYLLNISVDTADPQPEHIAEDLSFNDMESIVEIIVEQMLGFDDGLKEYDDHDSEGHSKKKNRKVDFVIAPAKWFSQADEQGLHIAGIFQNYIASTSCGFHDIDSPPPKV